MKSMRQGIALLLAMVMLVGVIQPTAFAAAVAAETGQAEQQPDTVPSVSTEAVTPEPSALPAPESIQPEPTDTVSKPEHSTTEAANPAAPEIVQRGTCGASVEWTLDLQGTLRIFGVGEMQDYRSRGETKSPWSSSADVHSVIVEEGVTGIGAFSFYKCNALTSISLPESLTRIGMGAFSDCKQLAMDLVIPSQVTVMDDYAFGSCEKLTSVTMQPGAQADPPIRKVIGQETFRGCIGLTAANLSDDVSTIGSHAFMNCTGLKQLHMPSGLQILESHAFDGCAGRCFGDSGGRPGDWHCGLSELQLAERRAFCRRPAEHFE